MRRWSVVAVALVVLGSAGAAAEPLPSTAPLVFARRQLAQLETAIGGLARGTARLRSRLDHKRLMPPPVSMQSRLNDGQVAYLLRDYLQASLILFDVVENPAYRGRHGYQDAVFQLADSLYQNRNFKASRKYLNILLGDIRSKYYQQALARVVSISLLTGRHDEVDAAYARLIRAGAGALLAPEIPYLYAKSLHARGRLEQALSAFDAIPRNSPFFFQARFFTGAIRARQRKYPKAIRRFRELIGYDPSAFNGTSPSQTREVRRRQAQVVELAHLALGRLHYELGMLNEAAASYLGVSRKSDAFPEALHELAWTWIKGKHYEKARRALEILMLSRFDIHFIPEAQVLLGDLQLLLQRFEDATKTYQAVKATFEPIQMELRALVAKRGDPVKYFNSLLAEKLERLDPETMLPPLAARWVRKETQVSQALTLVRDLSESRRQVHDAKGIVAKLEAALGAQDKLEMFPLLRDARAEVLDLVNRGLRARRLAGLVEYLLLRESLSPQERENHANAETVRGQVEAAFAKIPQSREDYLKRRESQQRRMAALGQQAHRLGIAIDGLKAQLVALARYWRDTRARQRFDAPQREKALGGIEGERAAIRALTQSQRSLVQRLAAERARVLVGDEAVAGEDRLRQRYGAALEAESTSLAAAASRMTGERSTLLTRLMGVRERIGRRLGELQAFRQRLRGQVEARAQEIRVQVEREKRRLASYDEQVRQQERRSERLAGAVAYVNYERARKKFYQLVIKADRGLTEVVWRQKERRSKKVRQLVLDRKSELKLIQDEFQDVRRN